MVEKTLYKQLTKAIIEWCKAQPESVHLQFVIGTLERVKMDYYNNLFGSMHTLNQFFKMMKGSKIEIPEDGSLSVFREIPKSKIKKTKE